MLSVSDLALARPAEEELTLGTALRSWSVALCRRFPV